MSEGTLEPLYRSLEGEYEKELALEKGGPMVIQVGGHGMLTRAEGSSGILIKQAPTREVRVYEALQGTGLQPYVPEYYGSSAGSTTGAAMTELRLADLTSDATAPCVMDIKIGKRTFLESEVTNATLRPDLAKKMAELDPAAVSERMLSEGVTKLAYMQFRETHSSSASFGWRIEGLKLAQGGAEHIKCKNLRTRTQLLDALRVYTQGRQRVVRGFLTQLESLRASLQQSEWFASHEMVGSSILFVYDDAPNDERPRCKMIDFAKTEEIANGRLSHRDEWVVGNHEDGYLIGLDSLIEVWGELVSGSGADAGAEAA